MSSIIEQIAFSPERAKLLIERLGEHIGLHSLTVEMVDGKVATGVLVEIGKDYISLMEDDTDIFIPFSSICNVRYPR